MNLHFDIEKARSEIASLVAANPELHADEVLKLDMLEAETSLKEVVELIIVGANDDGEDEEKNNRLTAIYEKLAYRSAHRREVKDRLVEKLMDHAGIAKLPTAFGTYYHTHRKSKPVILNEDALPDECFKTERRPSMTKIREYIEAHGGQMPAGVGMDNGSRSLAFRK